MHYFREAEQGMEVNHNVDQQGGDGSIFCRSPHVPALLLLHKKQLIRTLLLPVVSFLFLIKEADGRGLNTVYL